MTNYRGLEAYRNVPPEQKFAVLTSEITTPLATIRGYATLIQQTSRAANNEFPADLSEWIGKIVKAGNDIKQMLDVLSNRD
ncbi:MAG TPA: hypothetical protein VKQ72_03200 [Aggregatilineales bacterium]|nr:hypothetical protein [Aggregatilineales bacterium]